MVDMVWEFMKNVSIYTYVDMMAKEEGLKWLAHKLKK